ncbi:MAG: hypothetical protein KDA32_00075 [Phycisphaerales bacterium]|nr:hypothetical protein [Phycisphaerales bacterium]
MMKRFALAPLMVVPLVLTGCFPADTLNQDQTDTTSGRTISGIIGDAAAQSSSGTYMIVAQSAETMQIYTDTTDSLGAFQVNVPDSEGELFMVTVVSPNSQVAGPVVFERKGDMGMTGLELMGDVSLGKVDLPATLDGGPIEPGSGADFGDSTVATDVMALLDENGVPLGVPNIGKGDGAAGNMSSNPRQACDVDLDGLIDIFDADDDGDGVVDEFDDDAMLNPAEADGIQLNFFMNLKLNGEQARVFYDGDTTGIAESLKEDTVITFEVRGTDSLDSAIDSVRILSTPAPSYLSGATLLGSGSLWSDEGYKLEEDGANHFQAFVIPHADINAGDTFQVEVTFADSSTKTYARMINYVFKSIPRIEKTGESSSLEDVVLPGTIEFDGASDVTFEWAPPVDETGALMTDLNYFFEVFFYSATDNSQVDGITGGSTWPTAISGWSTEFRRFEVSASDLILTDSNTFMVTMPKDIFVDTVKTSDGDVAIGSYKIDIAAQNNGNNSAVMLDFEKK